MVIDFHTHVFPDRIAERTISSLAQRGGIKAHSDGTLTGLLSSMKTAGIDLAVNLPPLTSPKQFDSILGFAKELNSMHCDGPRVISFAGIHPEEPDALSRLCEISEAKIVGIKIHPDYQGRFIDDELYVKILCEAKRLGLITVTHAGYDVGFPGQPVRCTPLRILRLLDKIGGYPSLVLAHIGSNDMSKEVLDVLAGEDVYFDTAYTLQDIDRGLFLRILERHGADKVIFATDSPWRNQAEQIKILKGLGLGADTEDKILSKNAKRLLGI